MTAAVNPCSEFLVSLQGFALQGVASVIQDSVSVSTLTLFAMHSPTLKSHGSCCLIAHSANTHENVDCVPGVEIQKTLCNLDPWGFYGSIIDLSLRLFQKFDLNYPERISVCPAMGVTPNSAYLFVLAVSHLVTKDTRSTVMVVTGSGILLQICKLPSTTGSSRVVSPTCLSGIITTPYRRKV